MPNPYNRIVQTPAEKKAQQQARAAEKFRQVLDSPNNAGLDQSDLIKMEYQEGPVGVGTQGFIPPGTSAGTIQTLDGFSQRVPAQSFKESLTPEQQDQFFMPFPMTQPAPVEPETPWYADLPHVPGLSQAGSFVRDKAIDALQFTAEGGATAMGGIRLGVENVFGQEAADFYGKWYAGGIFGEEGAQEWMKTHGFPATAWLTEQIDPKKGFSNDVIREIGENPEAHPGDLYRMVIDAHEARPMRQQVVLGLISPDIVIPVGGIVSKLAKGVKLGGQTTQALVANALKLNKAIDPSSMRYRHTETIGTGQKQVIIVSHAAPEGRRITIQAGELPAEALERAQSATASTAARPGSLTPGKTPSVRLNEFVVTLSRAARGSEPDPSLAHIAELSEVYAKELLDEGILVLDKAGNYAPGPNAYFTDTGKARNLDQVDVRRSRNEAERVGEPPPRPNEPTPTNIMGETWDAGQQRWVTAASPAARGLESGSDYKILPSDANRIEVAQALASLGSPVDRIGREALEQWSGKPVGAGHVLRPRRADLPEEYIIADAPAFASKGITAVDRMEIIERFWRDMPKEFQGIGDEVLPTDAFKTGRKLRSVEPTGRSRYMEREIGLGDALAGALISGGANALRTAKVGDVLRPYPRGKQYKLISENPDRWEAVPYPGPQPGVGNAERINKIMEERAYVPGAWPATGAKALKDRIRLEVSKGFDATAGADAMEFIDSLPPNLLDFLMVSFRNTIDEATAAKIGSIGPGAQVAGF